MILFHPVEVQQEIKRDNPLYVGYFFDLYRLRWSTRKKKQAMILSVALAWYRVMKRHNKGLGFLQEEVLLTSLTSEVKDAKKILERFFKISRVGFNFNNGLKSPTIVVPKKQSKRMIDAIEGIINFVSFSPGLEPLDPKLTVSKVRTTKGRLPFIRAKLSETGREDLIAPVDWLYSQSGDINFYFRPSGKLQARDSSVWPIKNIELWPGWLRAEVFGVVIDIENAYSQFLLQHLKAKFKGAEEKMELMYPDIIRSDRDKKNFRQEICRDVLKLEINDENISKVKRLVMALANGSNISEGLIFNLARSSEAALLVKQANPDLTVDELRLAANRLQSIAKQFRSAKKVVYIHLFSKKPERDYAKRVFALYFDWERDQRYKIWHATGQTGLMLHDGIDGIITSLSAEELAYDIARKTSIRVSVKSPEELAT